MQLDLEEGSGTRLWPSCFPLLTNLGSVPLHHIEHGLRHPLGIYNVSLAPVSRAFSSVLDALQTAMDEPKFNDAHSTALTESYQRLLYALMEHLEGCEKIALCFFPPDVSEKHPLIKSLLKNRKIYREHTAKIVNAIKHSHNRLHPVLLRNHLIKAYGYFVAGPDSRGVIGPNPHIHRPWKGQATAFSFNRDLRRLFVSLYQIGEFVTEFLRGIGTPEPHDWKGASADELYDIAQRISRLPTFYFVDEVPNRNPVVFVPAGGVRKINIADDAARPTPVPIAGPFQATVQYLGDGATTMFKIPYMGKE